MLVAKNMKEGETASLNDCIVGWNKKVSRIFMG